MVLIQNFRGFTKNILKFIHEECGNLKGFADGEEITRNINEKKKPDILQAC